MTSAIKIIHGENGKPAASEALIEALCKVEGISGTCHFGAPFIQLDLETIALDAVLISPNVGVVIFDLLDSPTDYENIEDRQDALFHGLQGHLQPYKNLSHGRKFIPQIEVLSFNARPTSGDFSDTEEAASVVDVKGLESTLHQLKNESLSSTRIFEATLSAVQNLAGIRTHSTKRKTTTPGSRGAMLQWLEEQISVFDDQQAPLVTDTVNGVQRIRGLAGSGKTIVLAAKAAYLHVQHPDWKIAITFNTRALKGQLTRLVERFVAGYKKTTPDWNQIHIINAWGGGGGPENSGLYYQYCLATDQEPLDFREAKSKYGAGADYFSRVCQDALQKESPHTPSYDMILVDEAQDLPPSFLRISYQMLTKEKRLVYAYDELQNLSGRSLPEPDEIFGRTPEGAPIVSLKNKPRQDVILNRCYRNSRPVLATAHALGFGIYRTAPENRPTGLVQMFDTPHLWEEIGYQVDAGRLAKGCDVTLSRDPQASPEFLEKAGVDHPLIEFIVFDNEKAQNTWVAEQIQKNLEQEELEHQDIIVISPDRYNSPAKLGPISARLFQLGIQSHIAGVDTKPDEFFREKYPSITCTGIHRAKGNEAGMVYIIGAEGCRDAAQGLATIRNTLFTAITRSKAWVRVLGVGEEMELLKAEYERVVKNNYALTFHYPDEAQLEDLYKLYSSTEDPSQETAVALQKVLKTKGHRLTEGARTELERLLQAEHQ